MPNRPHPQAGGRQFSRQHKSPILNQMQHQVQQPMIGDYVVTQQIGSGSFAIVWKAQHKVTGMVVAIKEIPTEKLNGKLRESLHSEIAILKRTNHPNIIRLLDLMKYPDRMYLILEYCAGGDLSEYIRQNGQVREALARHFMRQLGAGLQVLRANNLIHRDLKPQNLLLSTVDKKAVLKIADFGFARLLQPQGLAETLCGSPLYMAPEILQFQKYDAKADLWSVGAILFELVCGHPPFNGANHVQLLRNIERSEARVPREVGEQLSESCISMIRHLLRRNPVERLTFEEFFHHPFLDLVSLESTHTMVSPVSSVERNQFAGTNKKDWSPISEVPLEKPPVDDALPFALNNGTQGWSEDRRKMGLQGINESEARALDGSPGPTAGGQKSERGFYQFLGLGPKNNDRNVNYSQTGAVVKGREVIVHRGFGVGQKVTVVYRDTEGKEVLQSEQEQLVHTTRDPGVNINSERGGVASHNVQIDKARTSREGRYGDGAEYFVETAAVNITARSTIGTVQNIQVLQNLSLASDGRNQPAVIGHEQKVVDGSQDLHTTGSNQGMKPVDSFECIERDYVVVEAPLRMSSESVTPNPLGRRHSQPKGSSTGLSEEQSRNSTSTSLSPQTSSEHYMTGGPSSDSPDRVLSLKHYATIIGEIATDKAQEDPLEALTLQLTCLAIWRKAIALCQSWTLDSSTGPAVNAEISSSVMPVPTGYSPVLPHDRQTNPAISSHHMSIDVNSKPSTSESPSFPAAASSEDMKEFSKTVSEQSVQDEQENPGSDPRHAVASIVETSFFEAVARAEELAACCGKAADGPDMPDAMELIFQAALVIGRAGVVEELMGKADIASEAYKRAFALFRFLLVEASGLSVNPPLVLSLADQQRLRRYADAVLTRHLQSSQQNAG